jgi:hypothetical protein
MRGAVYFAAAALVAAAAFWTYRVNYETKAALSRIDNLRAVIAAEREALVVLQAEWAYLNAPDRLARLAAQHADVLGLAPMDGAQFVALADLPDPPPETFWVRIDEDLLAPWRSVALGDLRLAEVQ